MRAENHGGAALEREGQGGQGGANPSVVADHAIADRDVEVHADEHAPAVELQVLDGILRHDRPYAGAVGD